MAEVSDVRTTEEKPETLATEIIKEVRAHGRRWFIISIIELIIIALMAAFFYWYSTTPISEDSVEIQNENGNASYVGNNMNGDFNYGYDQSDAQTQGSEG